MRLDRESKLFAAMAAAGLVACGGGGSPSTGGLAAPAAVVFSGVAATGAPMSGARLEVFDRSGVPVCSTTVSADGRYRCELPATAAAPFVVAAVHDGQKLFSAFGETKSSTVNVTPITNLIAARLASNGDPEQLLRDVVAHAEAVTPEKLASKVDEINAVLQPLLAAAGDQVNPLTGGFNADGAGHDRVLDSLQISIRPTGESANVEITVKSLPSAADAPPVEVKFNTADAAVPPIAASIRPEDLVADGTARLVADISARLAACYAVPLADRVAGGAIVAPACKSLFVDDDPATYLHDGARVGPTGAFAGMFGAGATGLQVDRAAFEYLASNGDIVFTFRYTTAAGNSDFNVLQARRAGTALKLIGNQAVYSANVVAAVQQRDFINSPAFSYRSTGYNFIVGNRVDGQGVPIFAKVEVTSPAGRVFVLQPTAGLSFLAITRENGSVTRSPGIKLAARFADPATPGNPADKDLDPLFAGVPFTDEQLAALPDHGVWKFEFFHAGGNQPNVIQHVRTLTRTLTAAEMMAQPFAAPTADAKAALIAAGNPAWGGTIFLNDQPTAEAPNWVRFAAPGNTDFWTVPDGATAPYLVSAFGFGPAPAPGAPTVFFNDNTTVSSTARQATLKCKAQSAGDTHCDQTLVDSYGAGTRLTSLELLARTQRQMQLSQLTALWTLH